MEINMKGYNLDSFKSKDIFTWEEIISIIEDLEADKHTLEEKLEDLKKDIEDNYTRISVSEQVCISDRDFL